MTIDMNQIKDLIEIGVMIAGALLVGVAVARARRKR
jgi:hypothetical protein